jgi:hypothetical protein
MVCSGSVFHKICTFTGQILIHLKYKYYEEFKNNVASDCLYNSWLYYCSGTTR